MSGCGAVDGGIAVMSLVLRFVREPRLTVHGTTQA